MRTKGAASAVLIQRAIELETKLGQLESALARTKAVGAVGVAAHGVAATRGDLHFALGQTERARTEWQTASASLKRGARGGRS